MKTDLGNCSTCGEGTPATETIKDTTGGLMDDQHYCADCAQQMRHLAKVTENRLAGAKKAAATRRTNRRKLAESLGLVCLMWLLLV